MLIVCWFYARRSSFELCGYHHRTYRNERFLIYFDASSYYKENNGKSKFYAKIKFYARFAK